MVQWWIGVAAIGVALLGAAGASRAQASAAAVAVLPASAASAPAAAWITVPRLTGRLHAADIGLVINSADPASVEVGEHYIAARHLQPQQVLRIDVPLKAVLTRDEFQRLRLAIDANFGPAVQALALAWKWPYAVECNSIGGALALGFDGELCKNGCAASQPSRYFNSPSARPLRDHGFRPVMLLAARTADEAKALIDRGVAADGALALRGRPPVRALLLTTDDVPRGVRTHLYPAPGLLRTIGVEVRVVAEAQLPTTKRVLMVTTGSVRAPVEPAPDWAAGGIGDHLTSFGGDLSNNHGHGTVLDWIASGAVASHGAVSEPCNHLQKFPHPQVLLLHYAQGATAIEAYWKSVAWPQQSLFVGEPLAAPFAPDAARR